MDITQLRSQIDEIDKELVELFKRRMNVSAAVSEYKRERGLPVLDGARERAILSRIGELSGEEFDAYARTLYATILDISRAYQHTKLNDSSEFSDMIKAATQNTCPVFPESATIACQGVEGAFSQIAAEKMFRNPNIMFFSSFDKVFSAIEAGMCRYGILPIENSTAGSVKQVYDLMISRDFKIVRSLRIKIDHNLLVKKGTKLSDITEIFSHEQAIEQCSEFLATLPSHIKITPVENTARAAEMVAQSKDMGVASISSRSCAMQYGLSTAKEAIQNNSNNHTRFICISRELEIYPGADRTSLMLITPHKPGSLYRILAKFNAHGINLIKLESRPIADRDFEFMFYFDLQVSIYSEKFDELLSELEYQGDEVRYLGSYQEVF